MGRKFTEADRGTARNRDEAYTEGYAAKYNEWLDRSNPYPEGDERHDGFDDGYAEAVAFAC